MISIYKQKKPRGPLTVGFLFFNDYDIIKASEKSVKIISIRFKKNTQVARPGYFLYTRKYNKKVI